MPNTIDYYLSLHSPWTYLGHGRLSAMAAEHSADVNVYPVDFAQVFQATGGLPLPQRSPARRAYRMAELRRWRDHLNSPLTLEPKFYPAPQQPAVGMVIATREAGQDAMTLAGAILRAVWVDDIDTGDPDALKRIADTLGLDGTSLVAKAESLATMEQNQKDTEQAIAAGVFGAPSYIYRGELYWGQDRLEFLARALARD